MTAPWYKKGPYFYYINISSVSSIFLVSQSTVLVSTRTRYWSSALVPEILRKDLRWIGEENYCHVSGTEVCHSHEISKNDRKLNQRNMRLLLLFFFFFQLSVFSSFMFQTWHYGHFWNILSSKSLYTLNFDRKTDNGTFKAILTLIT